MATKKTQPKKTEAAEPKKTTKKRTEPELSQLGYNGRDTPDGKVWSDRCGWVPE